MAQAARLSSRMQKELKQLRSDPPHGVSLLLPSESSDLSSSSLLNIGASIEGPEETAYTNGIFTIKVQIPERYPFQPPNVTFTTPIYHPNIDNGGRICLDILNLPPKGAWQPSMSIATVLTSIRLLLCEPNPDDGLMAEASREYKYNRHSFNEKARIWTEKYAKPLSTGRRNEEIALSSTILPPAAAVFADTFVEEPVKDRERSRKKLRLTGKTIPDGSVPETSNGDDKENLNPIQRLSVSHKRMDLYNSDPSQNVRTEPNSTHLNEKTEKGLIEDPKQLEARLNTLETIIVSDSEESEGEDAKPLRSRLSLSRKKHAGYCRG